MRRRVLDELHEAVAEDDLAGRHREVAADDEGARVDLAGHALVVGDVVGPGPHAARDARTAGVEGALHGGGVGPEVVRRGHGVHEDVAQEPEALVRRQVDGGRVAQVLDQAGRQQVALEEPEEGGVLLPRRVAEAAVLAPRLHGAGLLLARGPVDGGGGRLHDPAPVAGPGLHDAGRVLPGGRRRLRPRLHEAHRVEAFERGEGAELGLGIRLRARSGFRAALLRWGHEVLPSSFSDHSSGPALQPQPWRIARSTSAGAATSSSMQRRASSRALA